jgi:peptide/nickel transport system permease protein
MITYLIRRLGYAAIMLVLVSFVSFLIIDLPPGDYMDQKLSELAERGDRSAETRIEEYRAKYGLDKPLLTRYWLWASKFVTGDFGESFQFERPVKDILGERLQMTLVVALFATAVMWIVAIPAGVYSAVNQYSLGDQIMTAVAFIGMGMPNFMLALLILFFAVVVLDTDITGLFSREFRDAPWSLAKVWDLLKHLWIPAVISAITGSAGLIRIMRANLLDTLGQPFVEAARARGLRNRSVIWKHAVRIAINPLVVIFGSEHIPGIINRNMLLAWILNLPTIGPVFISALLVQDSYMAGTCLVFLIVLTLLGNLLADIGLAWLDPRIRLE